MAGGGGYLEDRPVLVNQTFQPFSKPSGPAGNLENRSTPDVAKDRRNLKKSKDFLKPARRLRHQGGGYLEGRPVLVNRTFQSLFRKAPTPSGQSAKPRHRRS